MNPHSEARFGRGTGVPDPIDVHVGLRLRARRLMLGWSQDRLASAVGLTFQQVQKYERGRNRIGASRLFEFARILDVPVGYFFEDMGESVMEGRPQRSGGLAEPATVFAPERECQADVIAVVEAYRAIPDPQVRRGVYEMARALARVCGDS